MNQSEESMPLYPVEAEHGHVLSGMCRDDRIHHLRAYEEWLASVSKVSRRQLRRQPDGTWSA